VKRSDFRYVEMAAVLRTEILSGYLKPGQYLLPETELCRKYSISRNSLRQALELLTEEGHLVRMRGRGNRVAEPIGAKPDETNTIVVLSPYRSSYAEEGLPMLIAAFNKEHPNVEVKLLYTGYLVDTIMRDLTGLGMKPDIVLAWDRHFCEFDAKEFVPLGGLVTDWADIPQKLIGAFSKQGEPYAVPVTYSPVFLACNPHLFEEAGVHMPVVGWTLEQFVEAAKRLTRDTDGDGMCETYGFGLSGSSIRWPVLAMKYGYRKRIGEDGRLRTDELEQAFAFFQRLLYTERITPVSGVGDWVFLNELFEEGKLAMILTTTLAMPEQRYHFPMRVLPLPRNEGAPIGSLMIANGFMLSRSSPNPELAGRFIQFALDYDYQKNMARHTGFLSVYDSVNRSVWTPYERNVLGIDPEHFEDAQFIHELFPAGVKPKELEQLMKKFWAGLESPRDVLNRMF